MALRVDEISAGKGQIDIISRVEKFSLRVKAAWKREIVGIHSRYVLSPGGRQPGVKCVYEALARSLDDPKPVVPDGSKIDIRTVIAAVIDNDHFEIDFGLVQDAAKRKRQVIASVSHWKND
jgi:hypothetical protein